jgi:hypothetical protein
MPDNKGYFKRESLPKFLTEKRFSELEEDLQDFIVLSSRMQRFLQSKIDLGNLDYLLEMARYQMELSYQSIVYIDSVSSEERKDYSVVMQGLESGMLSLDIALRMDRFYSSSCMELNKIDD